MGVSRTEASYPFRVALPMVYLNRIYTKSGDTGQTSLGNGARVAKTSQRIIAYGGVDELNATIGVAVNTELPDETRALLTSIQHDLFDLGADLCIPPQMNEAPGSALRITAAQVERLEAAIDRAVEQLSPLTSFVLPGGTPAAAALHVARTVCRRVEIGVIALAQEESIGPDCAIYLNRLSDLLFCLSRLCNDGGKADVLWIPGKNRPA